MALPVHLLFGLLQYSQCLLQTGLGLTHTLKSAVYMANELVKHLIGIGISIALELGSISLRTLHDFPFLVLRLLYNGLSLFLGLLDDFTLVDNAFSISLGPVADILSSGLSLLNNLIMVAHDFIGTAEFLR